MSDDVTRYDFEVDPIAQCECYMGAAPLGLYVQHDDYAALAARLRDAEAARDAAREWFQHAEEQRAKLEAENARLEVQARKGDLLDELAKRGWMLMDLSNSTIVREAGVGDPRKPNRDTTGPQWRVRRNDGYYSYGETPELAILQGMADEHHKYAAQEARDA